MVPGGSENGLIRQNTVDVDVVRGDVEAFDPADGLDDHLRPQEARRLRELREETTLTGTIDRLLFAGSHNGRPAFYFLICDVEGAPLLSGEEAAAHGPDNSFELRWATVAEFEQLNLYPADVRGPLAELLRS
ncbi:hypothetical protein ACIBQ1_30845 [Nonomuraea sp. NPDC050153]|uniref:hypothetical protein n=1 Tax=Nonomuraea sp. NPDC050153 TaxID=3364359 RepID=UPI0037A66A60